MCNIYSLIAMDPHTIMHRHIHKGLSIICTEIELSHIDKNFHNVLKRGGTQQQYPGIT